MSRWPLSAGGGYTIYVNAQSTTNVDIRVWESADDPARNFVSARAEGGSWRDLGTVPVAMDGVSASGRYRYGDIALTLPHDAPLTPAVSAELAGLRSRNAELEAQVERLRAENEELRARPTPTPAPAPSPSPSATPTTAPSAAPEGGEGAPTAAPVASPTASAAGAPAASDPCATERAVLALAEERLARATSSGARAIALGIEARARRGLVTCLGNVHAAREADAASPTSTPTGGSGSPPAASPSASPAATVAPTASATPDPFEGLVTCPEGFVPHRFPNGHVGCALTPAEIERRFALLECKEGYVPQRDPLGCYPTDAELERQRQAQAALCAEYTAIIEAVAAAYAEGDAARDEARAARQERAEATTPTKYDRAQAKLVAASAAMSAAYDRARELARSAGAFSSDVCSR